jgi:predicted dehydrogenase
MTTTAASQTARDHQLPRLGIIGAGDIANRTYVSLLKRVGDADVVAVYDQDPIRAAQLLETLLERWPQAKVVNSIDELRTEAQVDAVFNLTPAAVHHVVTRTALEAGLHVYSEKPLAPSVRDASELIALADANGLLLQCAPGNVASPRFSWVSEIIRSGQIGKPHLITGQMANMGPATWAPYRHDPRPFYDVGPLVDQGIYGLHWMTGLLGPAISVQAVVRTAIPERVTRTMGSTGVPFTFTKADQMLINLTFAEAHGHLFSSFAVAGTRVPHLEIHGSSGSLSLLDVDLESSRGTALICSLPVDSGAPPEWREIEQPSDPDLIATTDVIQDGAEHFVACLNGRAQPVLSAEHARHVVEIIDCVDESASTGTSIPLSTTFELPGRTAIAL